jgi:hypothetical protein
MSDETKEREPIVANIRMGAYKPPDAESVSTTLRAKGCSCQGKLGQGAGGDCKCGTDSGAGAE